MQELRNGLIDSLSTTFSMFGIPITLLEETSQKSLSSTEQVNVHMGFTDGLRGNIVFALSREAAVHVASTMMGGMSLSEIDDMAASALGELVNMVAGTVMMSLGSQKLINLSPPTLALGDDMFLLISRVTSNTMTVNMGEFRLSVSYSVE